MRSRNLFGNYLVKKSTVLFTKDKKKIGAQSQITIKPEEILGMLSITLNSYDSVLSVFRMGVVSARTPAI